MKVSDDAMCYVASHPGEPGYFFASVIDPKRAKEDAKEIAKLIRKGATISRVSVEAARAGLSEYFASRKP